MIVLKKTTYNSFRDPIFFIEYIVFILRLISVQFQLQDERTIVGKGLFKKETNIEVFLGLQVELSTGIY